MSIGYLSHRPKAWPNQALQQTAAAVSVSETSNSLGRRPLLSYAVRVRHLTFVQMALKELHHDNGVRVEQPALPGGTGSGGEPADKEHQLLAVRWLRVEP